MNLKLKLSSLWLFLLLLIVLIASAIFIKPYASKESFIGFYGSTTSNSTGLKIPNYPNTVDKLYDNDFFDPKNGNLVRVYASAYDAKAGQDTTGATIDHIDIVDRSGKTTSFKKGQAITTSTLTAVPNSYSSWSVFSTDASFSTITSNQVIYCAWGQDTYIHVLDINNNLNACGFLYNGSDSPPIYTNFNTTLPKLGAAVADNNANNDNYVKDEVFTNMVCYQLTSQISYMPSTGYLRIKDKTGNSIVYNRAGQTITSFKETDTIKSSTTPWMQVDLVGNNLVIFVPNQTKTIIILLKLNKDNVSYSIVSMYRFNADGTLQKDANTVVPIPTNLKSGNIGVTTMGDDSGLYGGLISSFNRNFSPDEQSYLIDNVMQSLKGALIPGSIGSGAGSGAGDVSYTNQQISDYILKTQIVPPICPAATVVCPGCSSGSCTSCGSPSASGPAPAGFVPSSAPAPARSGSPPPGSSPSGFYQGLKDFGSESKELIKSTGSGAADLLRSGASGTKNLIEETGSGGKHLLEETASGVTNLGKSAVGETVKLGKEAVGGTVDILKDVTGSAVGLAKSAGSGIKDILTGDQGSEYSKQQGIYGSQTGAGISSGSGTGGVSGTASTGYYGQGLQGPQNPWTYNGQLTEKPSSQFIPVTADFSKFSK